jgi:hypothetical protein
MSVPSGIVVEATTLFSILSTTVTFTVSPDGFTEKPHYQQ